MKSVVGQVVKSLFLMDYKKNDWGEKGFKTF